MSKACGRVIVGLLFALSCGESPVEQRDGGRSPDGGTQDAGREGTLDAGGDGGGSADAAIDAGAEFDAGVDGGLALDAGDPVGDAGADAGPLDGGSTDGGPSDGGSLDGGPSDGGSLDGGPSDGGSLDGGPSDAGCGCSVGLCLSDGGCGECRTGIDCPLGRPICGASSACVECVSTGDCSGGRFCSQGVCLTGCLDGSMCPSGVCLASHDCLNCQLDSQCAHGGLCGTGACSPACTVTCSGGLSCCDGRCVDPSRDPLHCGGCGPCDTGWFCGLGQCRPPRVNQVCWQPVVRVILDSIPFDDEASLSMGAALASACDAGALIVSSQADAGGALDVTTHEPLQAGEVLVLGGGSYFQQAMRWIEENGLAPVVDNDSQFNLRDGGLICTVPFARGDTHDVFVIEVVTAPSGAVVLNAAAYYGPGTLAAAWYFEHQVLSNLTSLSNGWYVVEWEDNPGAGTTGQPDAVDTWTVLGSGN